MRRQSTRLIIAACTFLVVLAPAIPTIGQPVEYSVTFSNATRARAPSWESPFVSVILWTWGDSHLGVLTFSSSEETSTCARLRDIVYDRTTGAFSFGVTVLVPKFDNERHRFDFFGSIDGDTLSGRLVESDVTSEEYRYFGYRDIRLPSGEVNASIARNYEDESGWLFAQEQRLNACDYSTVPKDSEPLMTRRELDPFEDRLEISGMVGGGIPVSGFADPERGNHARGAFNYFFAAELYIVPRFAAGVGMWVGEFEDQTIGNLLITDTMLVGLLGKVMLITHGPVLPFAQLGFGYTRLKFTDVGAGVTATVDEAPGVVIGLGVQWRMSPVFALDARASYLQAFHDGNRIYVVGLPSKLTFDTQYYSLEAGVSVFSF